MSDRSINRCLPVVMPCYNDKNSVLQCIDSVLASLYVVVQNDEFEYDPREYGRLLGPLMDRPKHVVFEVGISSSGRTFDEGKKIDWRDGVRAVFSVVKYSPVLERRRARSRR